ncbi:TPA: TolC family protein [Escherichia coli]|nr:TolC family protein [Escherichia coli]HCQ9044570.1 TolC family protein [Escherichia coli]
MKYIINLLGAIISLNSYALECRSCALEQYFLRTESYKSSLRDNEEKKLELDKKELSLLPNVYIGVGQQSNNDRSFKSVRESSLSVGISQTIYEGGSYRKTKKKINTDIKYNNLLIHDKRNSYLIDLYRAVIDYKYKLDLRELYTSQLEKQDVQLEAAKASLDAGDIAMIEYNAANLRRDEIRNNLSRIENEIRQSELDIFANFNVPENYIKNVSNNTILSCKTESAGNILTKSRELLHQSEAANYELEMTSVQPNVSFSVYVSPPDTGTWKDLSLKKSDFGASVNVVIPVSNFFSMNSIEKSHAIAVSRINDSYDEKDKIYFREKEKTISKIKELENSIALSRKAVELKSKEVDYILSRFKEKKETIMSYYRQLDEYESAKINLKKEEREVEFNKVYISILD